MRLLLPLISCFLLLGPANAQFYEDPLELILGNTRHYHQIIFFGVSEFIDFERIGRPFVLFSIGSHLSRLELPAVLSHGSAFIINKNLAYALAPAIVHWIENGDTNVFVVLGDTCMRYASRHLPLNRFIFASKTHGFQLPTCQQTGYEAHCSCKPLSNVEVISFLHNKLVLPSDGKRITLFPTMDSNRIVEQVLIWISSALNMDLFGFDIPGNDYAALLQPGFKSSGVSVHVSFPSGRDYTNHDEKFSQPFMEDYVTFATKRKKMDKSEPAESSLRRSVSYLARPLDEHVWQGIGIILSTSLFIFLGIGLAFPIRTCKLKRPFSYAGRKMLEVMMVIRWPYKRDCWAGKISAIASKSGLALILFPAAQLLVKHGIPNTMDFYFPKMSDIFSGEGFYPFASSGIRRELVNHLYWYGYNPYLLGPKPPYGLFGEQCVELHCVSFDWNSKLEEQQIWWWYQDYYVDRQRILEANFKLSARKSCPSCIQKLRDLDRLNDGGIIAHFREISTRRGPPQYLNWSYARVKSIRELIVFFEFLGAGVTVAIGSFNLEKIIYRRKYPAWLKMFPLLLLLGGTIGLGILNLSMDTSLSPPCKTVAICEISLGFITCMCVLFRHLAKSIMKYAECIGIIDTLFWIILTLSWYAIGVYCWVMGGNLFTFRAIPSLLISVLTPL